MRPGRAALAVAFIGALAFLVEGHALVPTKAAPGFAAWARSCVLERGALERILPLSVSSHPSGEPGSSLPDTDIGADVDAIVPPTGEPPSLECDQARRIVTQTRATLATPAEAIDKVRFATATADWLDPHGLWSVTKDAPVAASIALRGEALLQEIEAAPGSGECPAADALGAELAAWMESIRADVVEAERVALSGTADRRRGWEIARHTPFEDGDVSRSARDLARLLGADAGAITSAYGPALGPYAQIGIERIAPMKSPAAWRRVVLAAAVRAYVPQIDPHGAWAPLEEETSIYDLDLETTPPPRLWTEMTRTAIGVRIDRGARSPLADGDVVLRVAGLALSGLSVEQANQASVIARFAPTTVVALRAGAPAPISLEVSPELVLLSPPPTGAEESAALATTSIGYGSGRALVLTIPDVPDDLGDRVASAIRAARNTDGSSAGTPGSDSAGKPVELRELVGVVLDLRGNGGGSTDGATGALGVFLPGAALFPMRRRDGAIEVDTAPTIPRDLTWTGPVAALVDGDSASAAEMIAGALAAYGRGTVVGTRTYGKGCAQEYLDDDAGVGVLRLTTLVFCLPDGSPLQRVGVTPQVTLGMPNGPDRESTIPHAPAAWRGPDVRSAASMGSVPWPEHGGRVGTGGDADLFRALRALGTTHTASR